MLLQIGCLSVLLSVPVLTHKYHKQAPPAPPPNPFWRCPCPQPLCRPVTAEYRTQSFGFLDLSRRLDSSTWIALPSLTALILSHETLDEEPKIVVSVNSSLAALFCRSRRHGVRLLYRLIVEGPVSPALHRLVAVFALLPFDGVSLRIDDTLLETPGPAENATLRAMQLVRRLRPGAWVMLEQPSLRCARCAWMHRLPRRSVDFLYLPAYRDNDCPSAAFNSAAEATQALAAEGTADPDRLVLGVALFALRSDCDKGDAAAAAEEGGCVKSDACPSRVAPRDLWLTGALRRFGRFVQRTEADSRTALLQKVRLVRSRKLAGFGLFHANDLTANSSAEFWRDVASYKEAVLDQSTHHDVTAFFLLLVGLLVMI